MKVNMYKNRYKILQILTIIITLSVMIISLSMNEVSKYKVIIDNGYDENNQTLNLDISNNILSNNKDYEIIILNKENRLMYLEERIDLINDSNSSLVISLHKSEVILFSGIEVYCMINELNKESVSFGKSLEANLVKDGFKVNGVYYFYLPIVKGNIHRVEKELVDSEIKEEKTLAILEESKVPTVVLNYNFKEEIDINNLSLSVLKSIDDYFSVK